MNSPPKPTETTIEQDCVCLEWYRDPRWIVSAEINSDGIIHWAALLGDDDPRGVAKIVNGRLPHDLLAVLGRWAEHYGIDGDLKIPLSKVDELVNRH